MTADDIGARILEHIREEFLDDEEVDRQTSLFREQVLNSVDLTSLVVFLERSFGIRVGAMDIVYEHFDTVERMVEYVQRKRGA